MNPTHIMAPIQEKFATKEFDDLQKLAHEINVLNGWWRDRDALIEAGKAAGLGDVALTQVVIATLGLVNTEPSEAIEAARKHKPSDWADPFTKDTMVRELAGTVIRCMDLAERFKMPLGRAIIEELKSNAQRGFRHGGKAA